MFAHGEDNASVAQFDSLFKPYGIGNFIDDIASADPPACLRLSCAEGLSDGPLSWLLVRQTAR